MTLMHYERDETTRAHAEKHLVTQVVYAKTDVCLIDVSSDFTHR